MNRRLDSIVQEKAPKDYDERLKELQFQLYKLQVAYRRQGLSALVLVEGWDAAGKGGLIRRVTAELDPRFFEVVPIAAPDEMERKEHYMERFWREFPADGNWTVFDRTWYGRVLVERVEGFATPEEWSRAYTEINNIEAMMAADGRRVIKLFLHVSEREQEERLIQRMKQPWKRWKVSMEDFRNVVRRAAYEEAYEAMFEMTDTPHAPWFLIGANSKKHARITGMSILVDQLGKGVDLADPKLDSRLREAAEKIFGERVRLD